jgi:hypothetical protein
MQSSNRKDEESISLFERLPTEVLSEIIDMYLFETGNIATITHICSRIRQVTFGMAIVWNNIVLLTAEEPFGAEYWYEEVISSI